MSRSSDFSDHRTDAVHEETRRRFIKLPHGLLDDPEIDAYAIATYAALASYADFGRETGAAVSDRAAAEKAGCNVRTFQRRRELLRASGWIDWKSGRPRGSVNSYVVRQSSREAASESRTPYDCATYPSVSESDPGTSESRTTKSQYTKSQKQEQAVREVFALCRRLRAERIGKNGGRPLQLTDSRASKIRARLREGFSLDDLKDAARGFYADDWDRRDQYLDPKYPFRDDDTVRRFLEQHRQAQAGPHYERPR